MVFPRVLFTMWIYVITKSDPRYTIFSLVSLSATCCSLGEHSSCKRVPEAATRVPFLSFPPPRPQKRRASPAVPRGAHSTTLRSGGGPRFLRCLSLHQNFCPPAVRKSCSVWVLAGAPGGEGVCVAVNARGRAGEASVPRVLVHYCVVPLLVKLCDGCVNTLFSG